MSIYFIKKSSNEILKTVSYESISKTRYDNEEYTKLYKEYDADLHVIYEGNLPNYFTCESGELIELSQYEAFLNGDYELQDGEYADGDTESIVTVECPSDYHTWNSETEDYEFTKVEEKRTALIAAATTMKNDLEDNTVIEYGDFDTMSESISSITSAVSRFSTYGRSTTWYNLDKEGIAITDDNLQDLISLGLLTSDHIQRCFDTRGTIKTELESASDETLENYDLTARWEEVSASITY